MEPTKITDEELKELRDLRHKFRQKIFNFGQIQLERFGIEANIKELEERLNNIDNAEKDVQKEYLTIQNEESAFLTKIRQKYGEGTMSVDTGEFVPTLTK